jgi:hypothetical protein
MAKETYAVKLENGYVKLFDSTGVFKRYICGDAVKIETAGRKVRVTDRKGKVRTFHVEELDGKMQ